MCDNERNNIDRSKLTGIDESKLTGRIYPAIQSCVANRYKIILGIFAYYSFIFTAPQFKCRIDGTHVNLFVSVVFSMFAIHNLVNYWGNARDQQGIEEGKKPKWCQLKKYPWLEILFSFACLILIWVAHWVLAN